MSQLVSILLGVMMAVQGVKMAGENPQVVSGLEIEPAGRKIIVRPGVMRIDDKNVEIAQPVTLEVTPPEARTVKDEPYPTLSSEKPQAFMSGTPLKGLITGGTPLPGCLAPNSVVVKLPDDSIATRDKDYFLEDRWGSLSRLAGGMIAKDMAVKITYGIGQARIDSIVIDPRGAVTLVNGEAKMTTPPLPVAPQGTVELARIFFPQNATGVENWQVFPVGPSFPEPDAAEMTRRGSLVAKTLGKLRRGEPLTIVTWGDSVTAGGDASSHEKMFAEQFPIRLRERFPKSKITHVNAGIGATNTVGRLPALRKEVLEHKPDLVTIEFVNDMGIDEKTLQANYDKAIEQIRAAGAEIILITPHFTMPEMMGLAHPRGKETRPTVDFLRRVANQHHVALADASRRWEHLEIEGIPYIALLHNGINHPDDRGHELFVKELLTFFPSADAN